MFPDGVLVTVTARAPPLVLRYAVSTASPEKETAGNVNVPVPVVHGAVYAVEPFTISRTTGVALSQTPGAPPLPSPVYTVPDTEIV
ncbi:MAG: hypothetical protein UV60_C0009G0001 [Parcubacteria group bacterium GW2011_GWA2_43_11]|nr:MAG: hypothetical protein UV60_C0009G0001 [Parcubacteria group bacterium GW2011_GWA2_43_11]